MALIEEYERSGNWLFRWRSYLPLFLLPMLVIAIWQGEPVRAAFGDFSDNAWEVFSFAVSCLGLLVRVMVAGYAPRGTSGRNTTGQKADLLNTEGMYSQCRHPLYLGNYLIFLGIMLMPGAWWLPVISSLVYWVYYERIMFAEEAFVKSRFGPDYAAWGASVPAFIPRFSGWKTPGNGFSLKTVLKREFHSLLLICGLFPVMDAAEDVLAKRDVGSSWGVVLIAGVVAYVLLLVLKKTRALDVSGR